MKHSEKQSRLRYLIQFSVLLTVLGLTGCAPDLEDAKRLHSQERYVQAYETAADLINRRANRIHIPKAPKKAEEIADWLAESAVHSGAYYLDRPTSKECIEAIEIIKSSRKEIIFIEHCILPVSNPITLEPYLNYWRENFFPAQKTLPSDVQEMAKKVFEAN